jgi:NADH-quinone oxidoreductase subunit A
MGQYLPIVALLALTVVFAAVSFLASKLLAPRSPNHAKSAPYECGIVPGQEPPDRFPVRFYLIAMIFIVFDIEIIFLYPYAVVYRSLGAFGLVEMVVFAIAVFASFVFLIANGALDWGPLKRSHAGDPRVDRDRTTESTVRRVGLEGRDEPGRGVAA